MKIVSFNGLFEKIYGKLLPPLVYNETVENSVQMLSEVYGFRDSRSVFPKKLDFGKFRKLSEHVFRIVESQNHENDPK